MSMWRGSSRPSTTVGWTDSVTSSCPIQPLGSEAIRSRIRLRVRSTDFVARVDADEFGVICPGTGLEGLETLRRNLEAYVNFAQSVPVALSIGVAVPEPGDEHSLAVLERARDSVAERREVRPLRVVDDALADLLAPR